MEDKFWEDHLKDLLGDYKPEGVQPDWNAFSDYMRVHDVVSEWEQDEVFDENIKESLTDFEAPPQDVGWSLVEASLNKADQQFDEHIRHRIQNYEPKYHPHYFSLLLRNLSGIGYLRTKLIAFKIVEVAAVFLLLFTVVKMGQLGKLPLDKSLFEYAINSGNNSSPESIINKKDVTHPKAKPEINNNQSAADGNIIITDVSDFTSPIGTTDLNGTLSQGDVSAANIDHNRRITNSFNPIPITSISPFNNEITSGIKEAIADAKNNVTFDQENNSESKSIFKNLEVAGFIKTILSPIRWNHSKSLPKLAYVKQRSRTFTEFGIVSQLDYNKLNMPEDRLFNSGKQIIFPKQGIPSSSIGGGFSLALAHPNWAIETGMIYNPKNFKPGRSAKAGDGADYSNVEFEAIRLQLISVPLNFRYRFDNKGAFKIYGLAGFGMHLIAQSDIDIPIKNHFPSLRPGESPLRNPVYDEPIEESRRIREHFLDGAPINTKSFFSAQGGVGMEYMISENKTLFLQSAVQFQLPNVKFGDNNGKYMRSATIQAGVRTPLGK